MASNTMNLSGVIDSSVVNTLIIGGLALFAGYYLINKLNAGIKTTTDGLANWWVGLDGSVEFTDFTVSRLWRDQFTIDWQMLPDVFELYFKAYPNAMARILDYNKVLKPQYRAEVSY